MAICEAAASFAAAAGSVPGSNSTLAFGRLFADFFQRRRGEVNGLAPLRNAGARVGGVSAGGVDLGRAATGENADVGMRADDGDGLNGGCVERQDVAGVLQQNDAFVGDVLGIVASAEGIDDLGDGRVVDDAVREHAAQDAMNHVIEARHRDLIALDSLLQRIAEVAGAGLLLVEAGDGGVDGGVGAAPVGEDEALEVEIFFEDLIEEVVVLAGPVGWGVGGDGDAVIGAHDAGRIGEADGDLEGEEIAFARGTLVDGDVDGGAPGLLVVEGVVLDVAHDLVGLNAASEFADHGAGKNRIFAGVFEVAAVAWVAGDVDTAADGHVVAGVAQLAADD